ncbi:hypothetical protein [Nocardioides sp.]|uniref:hypothetical protein n=1 Tax=Nocardioides sp. TaxID=35761 RepID=UPI0025D65A17|nr:hypothetical protein [Nocardioides sp.]
MRSRFRHAPTALLAVALALPVAAPVADAAPVGPAPRTVTVRADCVPGGVVVLSQVAGADSTHVTIEGRHVSDGRWRGEYLLEVGEDDTHDVRLDVRAEAGAFRHEFDVPGTGQAAILDLARGRGRGCFASYDEDTPATIVGGRNVDALVRHPGPRRLVARAGLDCGEGTRWRAELRVELADRELTLRGTPVRCRDGRAEFGWRRDLDAPGDPEAPVGLTLLVRGPGGQTRSVAYDATSPATD